MILNKMSKLAWNRLAMPRAKPSTMLRTPSLMDNVSTPRTEQIRCAECPPSADQFE